MIATTEPTVRADRQARRPWWAQHRTAPGRPTRPTRLPYDRPAEVLAVLQHARAIVEAGWVQNRWTAPAPALATAGATAGPADGTATGSVQACLVAAVALAARARDPRADLAVATGPALAHVWDALHGDDRLPRAGGRSAAHEVRVARMRELARWNDQPGRRRAEVVAALDRAAAQVVATTVEPQRA